MIFTLVIRSVRHEWARFLSAILGVAAAVGLLSWHLGLVETALHSGHDTAARAAAPFTAWIGAPMPGRGPFANEASGTDASQARKQKGEDMPGKGRDFRKDTSQEGKTRATSEATMGRRGMFGGAGNSAVPNKLVDALSGHPGVEKVVPLTTVAATLDMRPGGRVLQGPPFRGIVAELPDGGIPFEAPVVEGRLPDSSSNDAEVVASLSLFGTRVPKPEVGAIVPFVMAKGTVSVKIVGFFDAGTLVPSFPSLYANGSAMQGLANAAGRPGFPVSLVLVRTGKGVDPESVGSIIDRLPEARGCTLYTVDAVAARFRSDTMRNFLAQAPMSLALAAITASCLLSTVLAIGLALRRRRIAVLRCAGMTRRGVASFVLAETTCALVPGWLLGLGGAALFLRIWLASESASPEIPSSIWIGWQTPLFGALLALVVGLFAAVAPLTAAMRVKPLEALGGDTTASRPVRPLGAIAAILLLLPLPLIAMDFAIASNIKTLLMVAVGIPCLIGSLCLGMHPFMRLVEKVLLRPLGHLLGLDPRLLERRLSRDPARAAGTVLTLALGLGGFIAIHIWGGTLMASFVPNKEWPDAIVSALPSGFDDSQVDAVRRCAGVADGRALKIECTQFPIDEILTRGSGTSEVADAVTTATPRVGAKQIPQGVLLLFGTDSMEAFGGDAPLAPMKFIEGERRQAAESLAGGDFCIIPKMLSNLTGLHKGDSLVVDGRRLEVAAVVDLNWHMVTSRANVRTRFGGKRTRGEGGRPDMPFQRTIGMAFTSEGVVRDLTGNIDRTYFLWLDMAAPLRSINALQATVRLDEEIRAAVGDDGSSAIKVHHRDEISDGTLSHGSDILGAMARIPFWSLVVTSTGIAVLLVASVRGSKREFEIMRAVGMTRTQLSRLIFGEALLVTFCAVVLSLLCGILVGWSFTGLSSWLVSGGLDVRLSIPWATIGKGIAFAIALCVMMAMIPLSRLVKMVDGK